MRAPWRATPLLLRSTRMSWVPGSATVTARVGGSPARPRRSRCGSRAGATTSPRWATCSTASGRPGPPPRFQARARAVGRPCTAPTCVQPAKPTTARSPRSCAGWKCSTTSTSLPPTCALPRRPVATCWPDCSTPTAPWSRVSGPSSSPSRASDSRTTSTSSSSASATGAVGPPSESLDAPRLRRSATSSTSRQSMTSSSSSGRPCCTRRSGPRQRSASESATSPP